MNPNSPNAEIPSECVLLSTLDYVLFDTSPSIYRSLKGEKYICKSDAYVILQKLTLEVYQFEKPKIFRSLLAIFLRSQELKNLDKCEFVIYNPKVFDSIKKEIQDDIKTFGTDVRLPMMTEIMKLEFPRLLLKFKNSIKIDWQDSESEIFEINLRSYLLEFHMIPNFAYLLTILYCTTERIVNLLQRIINCRLEIFSAGGPKPTLKKFVHSQKGCHRVYGRKCEQCDAENSKTQKDQKLAILEKELADLKISHLKMLEEDQEKSLEIGELQQKNFKLSVKNETDDVQMKQLTDKLAKSELSVDYGTVGTSKISPQKIRCLICEKSIESGEDQIIRCHCVPRIRKIPFEVCNHFAQRAQRLSGLQWRHPEVLKPRIRIVSFCYKLFKMCC
ncbi:Protein CBG21959 [Caenorhabditis briggsae]|uniref:Protein CBG21959 n=1 Tax=Caenorhabditis briggsae TaxID=6238 RepID=A8Y148_CAEBR|nr:Protein CBG21959 [Caenorhabditis briggsae]CAP38609.1 Protein CBG21959 [Caenorhabditis briggsae]